MTSQINLPTALLARFQNKLSAFFAAQAGDDKFARRPILGLTLVVPGEPEAILEIRPEWSRRFKRLDTSTLVVDLLVNRLGHEELFQRTKYRPVEFGLTLSSYDARISRRSLRYGDDGQERLTQVVADFLADPMASLSRSNERCCLCRRKLTDGTSVLRGYGPECSKKIGALLDFFAEERCEVRETSAPFLDFADLLQEPGDPDDDSQEWSDPDIEVVGEDEVSFVEEDEPVAGEVPSPENPVPGPEPEQPDPLDQYFDPEAGVWRVESHRGEIIVGLPWAAGTPIDVVLDDAVDTISGYIEDGITDDNDEPITDFHSFVLWKGLDVAAVATEAPTDPSRLEFTMFRV
jgi:hypothetical protein